MSVKPAPTDWIPGLFDHVIWTVDNQGYEVTSVIKNNSKVLIWIQNSKTREIKLARLSELKYWEREEGEL